MTMNRVQRIHELLREAIDEAVADRDRLWYEALSETETPLFGEGRVLPFVPRSPDQVPEMLRRLEGVIKHRAAKG